MSQNDVTLREDADPQPHPREVRLRWRVAFALAVVVQLAILYVPRAVSPPSGFPWDKVVHALMFAAVVWTGARAGVLVWPLVVIMLVHAPLSEVLQHTLLPNRSGDPADALADAVGTLLAAAAMVLAPRLRRRP